MNSVLLDLGIIKIYWYSFFMFLAILTGGTLAIKEAKKWQIPEDFMINLFFFLIPVSFIGARLYFVAFNFDLYSENLLDIIKIWEGGLAIHGAIIAGTIWTLIYSLKYKISMKRLFDILVVGLIIGQAIGRWGNFFNSEAHGFATTAEFLKSFIPINFIVEGMNIGGIYYHPTFLYESLWCLIGFIVLLIVRRMKYIKLGQITSIYFIWYGIGRFFIEILRTDSLMYQTFKVAQIASIALVVIGILMFLIYNRGSKLTELYNDEENIDEVRF